MKKKALISSSLLAAGALASFAAEAPKRPNILWILAEDMSLDLGCYGTEEVKTPNLDRLASEGIVYTNARCATPISSPSRSAMLTGVHSTVFDACNHRSNRDKPLPEGIRPFTNHLRDAGYRCVLGQEGIFRNPYSPKNQSQSAYKIDGNFKWDEIGKYYDGVSDFGVFDCYDDIVSAGPFFNQVTLFVTHRGDWWKELRERSPHPVDPARVKLPPYMADHPKIRQEWACYLDQVEYMDAEVGMLLSRLDSLGKLSNTIVIFIGDNGRADIRGKGFLYDAGTQVPMIIWGPGIRHTVVDEVVSTLDLSATVLQLAGAKIPPGLDSKPLLDRRLRPVDVRDYAFSSRDTWDEVAECSRAITTDRYVYIRNYFPDEPYDRPQVYLDFHRPALHVMRSLKAEGRLHGPELLFFSDTKPEEELYDFLKDPYNIHNLATDPAYASVLEECRAMLKERQAAWKDTGYEDRLERAANTVLAKDNLRSYVQKKHPEGWQDILSGELDCNYSAWNKEFNKWLKSKKK